MHFHPPLRRLEPAPVLEGANQALFGLLEDTGKINIAAWHCTICGEVIDPVILRNRYSPPLNLLYGTKARKFRSAGDGRSYSVEWEHVSEGTEANENEDSSTDVSNPCAYAA